MSINVDDLPKGEDLTKLLISSMVDYIIDEKNKFSELAESPFLEKSVKGQVISAKSEGLSPWRLFAPTKFQNLHDLIETVGNSIEVEVVYKS